MGVSRVPLRTPPPSPNLGYCYRHPRWPTKTRRGQRFGIEIFHRNLLKIFWQSKSKWKYIGVPKNICDILQNREQFLSILPCFYRGSTMSTVAHERVTRSNPAPTPALSAGASACAGGCATPPAAPGQRLISPRPDRATARFVPAGIVTDQLPCYTTGHLGAGLGARN